MVNIRSEDSHLSLIIEKKTAQRAIFLQEISLQEIFIPYRFKEELQIYAKIYVY